MFNSPKSNIIRCNLLAGLLILDDDDFHGADICRVLVGLQICLVDVDLLVLIVGRRLPARNVYLAIFLVHLPELRCNGSTCCCANAPLPIEGHVVLLLCHTSSPPWSYLKITKAGYSQVACL